MTPRCSIVVPVRNHAGLTRRCLDAILAEPPATETEIIVVDDASTDATPDLVAAYGGALRSITRPENGGFAAACNDGAEVARGHYLLFLNNDTVPRAGWLDALVAVADRNPRAGVVGSKLLFSNNTVQHAGVVICQDDRPRHLYAGFPADHPAVTKARRFQAVTFACALVRRYAFEQVGGLDPLFRNCLEDADFCLRAGERGWEVHYCPDSVVYHLESASRGRRSPEFHQSEQLFRQRWRGRVRRDDLDYYNEDRLLRMHYRDAYPLQMEIAPELAVIPADDRAEAVERHLETATREAIDLLRESARLTSYIAERELEVARGRPLGTPTGAESVNEDEDEPSPSARQNGAEGARALDPGDLLTRMRALEQEIFDLQTELASRVGGDRTDGANERFGASEYLGYKRLIDEVRSSVLATLPPEATVIVVSRGDDELVSLGQMRAMHFPQDDDGFWAGTYPEDSSVAIAHLEHLREKGGEYIVFPSTSLWWLDHYAELERHLEDRYAVVARNHACAIFALGESGP